MDDEAEGKTYAECEAAFHRAKETILDAHLPRKAATAIRANLKVHGLDFPKWDRFIESLPADKNGSQPSPPPKTSAGDAADPFNPDQVLAYRSSPMLSAPTLFPPIDNRLRGGGLPRGTLTCLTGPPESGKTRLLVQLGIGLSETMPVIMLLPDWGRSAAADIMAVMMGFDPKRIDAEPQEAAKWLGTKTNTRKIFFMDDNATLPQLFDQADKMGACAVLFDSIQTVPPFDIPNYEKAPAADKNRVLLRYIRGRMHETDGRQAHTVVFTSESTRAFFAAKDRSERSTEIAAARGGGVEFAADFLIALHRAEGETDQRQVIFAKNRYRPFTRLPHEITASYQPDGRMIEVSAEEAASAEKSAYETSILPIKRVLREVLAAGTQPSFRKFREAVQAADPSIKDKIFVKVLSIMVKVDRSIQEGDGPRGATTYSLAYDDPSDS